jgi:hypothetical protein
MVKQFVKHEHILCEGCGSISWILVCMRTVCATVPDGMWHYVRVYYQVWRYCHYKSRSIKWFINIQVTSSSKTLSHVDIQVRSNVELDLLKKIYILKLQSAPRSKHTPSRLYKLFIIWWIFDRASWYRIEILQPTWCTIFFIQQ